MNKQLQNINNSQLVSGVALMSTAALSVYSIKNIMDLNRKMEEVREDIDKIKQFVTDSQRKNNIASANLGKKIEEVQGKFLHVMSKAVSHSPIPEPKIVEIPNEENDVDSAVNNFLS